MSLVGPFGSGVSNDNTDRIISFCQGARLRIAGSWYRCKDIHRYIPAVVEVFQAMLRFVKFFYCYTVYGDRFLQMFHELSL